MVNSKAWKTGKGKEGFFQRANGVKANTGKAEQAGMWSGEERPGTKDGASLLLFKRRKHGKQMK